MNLNIKSVTFPRKLIPLVVLAAAIILFTGCSVCNRRGLQKAEEQKNVDERVAAYEKIIRECQDCPEIIKDARDNITRLFFLRAERENGSVAYSKYEQVAKSNIPSNEYVKRSKAEMERIRKKDLGEAMIENTKESYSKILNLYQGTAEADLAYRGIVGLDWKQAEKNNEPISYKGFLEQHRRFLQDKGDPGNYMGKAKDALEWFAIKSRRSISETETYLSGHPDNAEAAGHLKQLHFDEIGAARSVEATISACKTYIDKYRSDRDLLFRKVSIRLENAKYKRAMEEEIVENQLKYCDDFLNEYPDSEFRFDILDVLFRIHDSGDGFGCGNTPVKLPEISESYCQHLYAWQPFSRYGFLNFRPDDLGARYKKHVERCLQNESERLNDRWTEDYFEYVKRYNDAQKNMIGFLEDKNELARQIGSLSLMEKSIRSANAILQTRISEIPESYIVHVKIADAHQFSTAELSRLSMSRSFGLLEKVFPRLIQTMTLSYNGRLKEEVIEMFTEGRVEQYEFDPVWYFPDEGRTGSNVFNFIQAFRVYPSIGNTRAGEMSRSNPLTGILPDPVPPDYSNTLSENSNFPLVIAKFYENGKVKSKYCKEVAYMKARVSKSNRDSSEKRRLANTEYGKRVQKEKTFFKAKKDDIEKKTMRLCHKLADWGANDGFENLGQIVGEDMEQRLDNFSMPMCRMGSNGIVAQMKDNLFQFLNTAEETLQNAINEAADKLNAHVGEREIILVTNSWEPMGHEIDPEDQFLKIKEEVATKYDEKVEKIARFRFYRIENGAFKEEFAKDYYRKPVPVSFTIPFKAVSTIDDQTRKLDTLVGLKVKLSRLPSEG